MEGENVMALLILLALFGTNPQVGHARDILIEVFGELGGPGL